VTGLSTEIGPAAFDAARAKAALPIVQQTVKTLQQPRPAGAYIYYAALAACAGEQAEVERVLSQIIGPAEMAIWQIILRAEAELAVESPPPESAAIEQLRAQLLKIQPAAKPTALLILGVADIRSTDEETVRRGLLSLLTVPAAHASDHADLASAALYQAALTLDKLKDVAGAASVRRELASRFAATPVSPRGSHSKP
jgi:hypothetical protein